MVVGTVVGTEHELRRILVLEYIMIGAAGLIIFVSFIGVYVPMFINNASRKRQVGDAFLAIPPAFCKKLQKRTERRLAQLQNGNESDGDSDVECESEDEVEAVFELGTKETKGVQGIEAGRKSSGRTEKPRKAARVVPVGVDGDGKKERQMQDDPCMAKLGKQLWMVLRIGVTFWVVLTFNVVRIQMAQQERLQVLGKSKITFSAGYRFKFNDAISYWQIQPLERPDWEPAFSSETEILDRLQFFYDTFMIEDRNIKYGNEALNIAPFGRTQGSQYEILFKDACNDACVAYISDGGIGSHVQDLTHGAVLAIDEAMQHTLVMTQLYKGYFVETDPTKRAELEQEIHREQLRNLDILPGLFLQSALESFTADAGKELRESVTQVETNAIIACVIFFFALGISHLLSLRGFQRLDQDIKKSHSMLMMLPSEVFVKVPQIMKLVQNQ
uniref:Uncharacterized protein n=1 Tax=Mucochytrium quahogii TaxID=96639 RepID=A0A7S2RVD6_9STRA|mmetsp:Transcript_20684/g.45165  ORF Transcript_20684/g.45165 Transcript_20684/m.45165 type:complete len:444 (+) Transcript_20684:42-1373(+)